MEAAGIIPEEDEVGDEAEFADIEEAPDSGEERLSVFEDFLEQLNLEEDDEEEDE